MDNFLTSLYFELFKLREREKKLMSNNVWTDDESGQNDCIRNDQSISECREFDQVLQNLIKHYLQHISQ